jgi:prolipoprotein diacylglyceryltransferase
MNNTLYGVISIAAIIIGPIIAVQLQKFIEKRTDAQSRRMRVFKILMATRAARLASDHIMA